MSPIVWSQDRPKQNARKYRLRDATPDENAAHVRAVLIGRLEKLWANEVQHDLRAKGLDPEDIEMVFERIQIAFFPEEFVGDESVELRKRQELQRKRGLVPAQGLERVGAERLRLFAERLRIARQANG